jgi:hypothetical protein
LGFLAILAAAALIGSSGLSGAAFAAKPGDKFIVEIDRRVTVRQNTNASNARQFMRFNGEILAASKTGFKIGWTLDSFTANGEMDAARTAIFDALNGVKLTFSTDLWGRPQTIANWGDVRLQLKASLEKAARGTDAARTTIDRALAGLARHDGISALWFYLPDAVLLGEGQGTVLLPGAVTTAPYKLRSPLGGPPLDAVESHRLVRYDPAKGLRVFERLRVTDPKAARKRIVETLTIRASELKLSPKQIQEYADRYMLSNGEAAYWVVREADNWVIHLTDNRRQVAGLPDKLRTRLVRTTITVRRLAK